MATHLRIAGMVQGVGYRAAFESHARALGLAGWVRNRIDGDVEAAVSGEDQSVQSMIAWARRGPGAARVDSVSVTEIDDDAVTPGRFEVLPTK